MTPVPKGEDPYHTPEREVRDVAFMTDTHRWPGNGCYLKRLSAASKPWRTVLEFGLLRPGFQVEFQGQVKQYTNAQEIYDDGWRVD